MTVESTIQITCSGCNTVLKAKPEWAGKQAKCAKCGATIEIPALVQSKVQVDAPPATDRQKEYAKSLGIDFPDKINRRDISKLIDDAVAKSDDERFERLDELGRREGQAWEEMRQEVLAEIDAEDCRLSKATKSQIIEALSERGLAAILITIPWDDIVDFHDLTGVKVEISFSDDMTQEDVEATIITYATEIMKRKGII